MSNDNPSPEKALIHVMVVMAAADRDMTDRELKRIVDQVRNLPVFADFDERDLIHSAEECAARLGQEGGLDRFLDVVADSLPPNLVETAYALACEIAAADLRVLPEETRLLRMLRDRLGLDRLIASAIERAVKARHATVQPTPSSPHRPALRPTADPAHPEVPDLDKHVDSTLQQG